MKLARAGLGVVLAGLTGCAVPSGTTIVDGPREVTVSGRLSGIIDDDELVRAWIETSDGERIEVMYLDHWRIEANPIRVIDEDDRVIAQAGDRIVIRGYEGGIGASLCDADRMISANAVEVDGQSR